MYSFVFSIQGTFAEDDRVSWFVSYFVYDSMTDSKIPDSLFPTHIQESSQQMLFCSEYLTTANTQSSSVLFCCS